MADREKVMSWLEGLAEPDWRVFHSDSEVQNIAKSALELLKEQEAVEPLSDPYVYWRCGSCGREIGFKHNFCEWCGRSVKWE